MYEEGLRCRTNDFGEPMQRTQITILQQRRRTIHERENPHFAISDDYHESLWEE